MIQENHSLFGLLIPQVLMTQHCSSIFSMNITDAYKNCYIDHFPVFSDFVLVNLFNEMVYYSEEISDEISLTQHSTRPELFDLTHALILEPIIQKEADKYSKIIYDLKNIEINIGAQNSSELDLMSVIKYARLLVEIDDAQTGHIRDIFIKPAFTKLNAILDLFRNEVPMNPKWFFRTLRELSEEISKAAVRYDQFEIPEGYQIVKNSIKAKNFSLPVEFTIPGENKNIEVLIPGTRIINPKIYKRKIIVEMTQAGVFSIPPMLERHLINVPEEFRQQLQELQKNAFFLHLKNVYPLETTD